MSEIVADAPSRANAPASNPESIFYRPAGEQAQATEPEPISPTRIQLFIRPLIGKKFEIPFSKFHDEVGLENPRLTPSKWDGSAVGVCTDDTTELIALFEPNKKHQWDGLTEVTVTIDPETCGAEWSAPNKFTQALKKFTQAMGGVVYDGLGARLSDEAIGELQVHIRSVIHRRIEAQEDAGAVKVGRFTTRVPGTLSYQFTLKTKAPGQRYPDWTHVRFNAAALPYYAGTAEGYKMAKELVEYLKTHRTSDAQLFDTICDAAAMIKVKRHPGFDGRHAEHAANAFMQCMVTLIKLGTKSLNMKWLDHHITAYEGYEAEYGPTRDAKKAAVVQRLKEARAAKKAQREGGAAC